MSQQKDKRTDTQKADHRRQIAALYVRGVTQFQIATDLGLSQATVSRDLKAIHAAWLKDMLASFDERKARELARIDELEREAWGAWKASKDEKVISSTKRVTGASAKDEAGIRREKRDGAVEYLRTVQWCIEQRCKIFGFYAPTKLTVEQMDAIIDQLAPTQQDGIAKQFVN